MTSTAGPFGVADCGVVTDLLPRRFYKLDEVAEMLSTSHSHVYALVRRGDLVAIELGGGASTASNSARSTGTSKDPYAETNEWIAAHPFVECPSPIEGGTNTEPGDDPAPDVDTKQ